MSVIFGETVTVIRRVADGTDALGAPTYRDVEDSVDDVLVAPGALSDVESSIRPDGVRVVYNLHFPKGFEGSLRGARVRVRGEVYAVIGDPKPYTLANTPTRWCMPVEVEAVHG